MNINSVVQRTVVTTQRRNEIVVDNVELRELLRRAGYQIPATARIYFVVPGGGDWSNTDIDISREHPVTIEWTDIYNRSNPPMIDKKPASRGVVNSIARLRELRYMTKGAGAKPRKAPAKPTIEQLRADVAKVTPAPKKRKKSKKRSRR